jgi:hypothetical protein
LFIHSFIFNPKLIEYKIEEDLPDDDVENWEIDGISGLYINTDFTRDKEIYYLDIDFITELFEEVYEDKIVHYNQDYFLGKTTRSRNYPEDYKGMLPKDS